MVNIEEFKQVHKDELLQHTLHDLVVLSGKFDYEAQYTIMQMNNYLYDVKHVIDQKMDVSIISHLTYNLNIQLLHCYNRTKDYYDASRYYLLGDHGIDMVGLIKDFQEKEDQIKNRINSFNKISLFEIYCAHPADFLAAEHYRRGIEDKNKPLLNLERELAFMNGAQLLKCLVYLMELTEKKILDIRNGITYETNETLELVYDLNYVFYAEHYWINESAQYRTYVSEGELMDEVTPLGLLDCYKQTLSDFKTNDTGKVWAENSASKSELTYELKRFNLTIEKWQYFFKTIFKLEELKRWKNELKSSAKSAKSKQKKSLVEKQEKPRETMTFKKGKNVLDGHLVLLFNKLTKEGWIKGNEADFKALFSGKRDGDCILTWLNPFSKAALFTLFRTFQQENLIIVPEGYALSPILEGHFKDSSENWLTGLDKGNKHTSKALTVINECVRLLKTDPRRLISGDYQDDEDFQSIYDPYDHQDLQMHQR